MLVPSSVIYLYYNYSPSPPRADMHVVSEWKVIDGPYQGTIRIHLHSYHDVDD